MHDIIVTMILLIAKTQFQLKLCFKNMHDIIIVTMILLITAIQFQLKLCCMYKKVNDNYILHYGPILIIGHLRMTTVPIETE